MATPPLEPTPGTVGTPAVENHFLRRARNHEIRRSRRTRTLLAASVVWSFRLALLGAVAVAAVHGWRNVATSPKYALRKIQMAGVQGPLRQELGERLGRFHGENLFRLPLQDVADAAKSHPWVLDATVRRMLPDALDVRIWERVPVALVQIGSTVELVDGVGVLLGPPRAGLAPASLDLPVIAGLPGDGAGDGAIPRDLHRGLEALHALEEMAPEMLPAISEIRVDHESDLELVLRDRGRSLLVSGARFRDEMQKYFQVKDALAARVPGYRRVDLRFRSRIIVRTDDETLRGTHLHPS